jgi:peptide/nickel transport system ATP-binding protein
MKQPVLEIDDLHVAFESDDGNRVNAVRGVTLRAEPGQRLGLVGESGSGKTTTILAAMGLLPPTATVRGSVRIRGGDDALAQGDASMRGYRWKDVSMVFQGAMNSLDPLKTVGSQIASPMELHRIAKGADAEARARELLRTVGISPDAHDRYPHEFSGGMRQRVCIAVALACDPCVLLADEPTTALDVIIQSQILDLLVHLSEVRELAVILVTHDLPVVAETCTDVAVMYAGEIVEQGTTDQVLERPMHPYTRRLLLATPDLDSTVTPQPILGAPPALDRPILGCPFEPRCPDAFDPCKLDPPALRALDGTRSAACHLHDPSKLRTAVPSPDSD